MKNEAWRDKNPHFRLKAECVWEVKEVKEASVTEQKNGKQSGGDRAIKEASLNWSMLNSVGLPYVALHLNKPSSGLSMEVLYTFMTRENAWVGRGEMCISQRKG